MVNCLFFVNCFFLDLSVEFYCSGSSPSFDDPNYIFRFRLGAIDHGLFSFVDTHHNDWPIVLVTNPKNYLFNIPHREHPNLQKGKSPLSFNKNPNLSLTILIPTSTLLQTQPTSEYLHFRQHQ